MALKTSTSGATPTFQSVLRRKDLAASYMMGGQNIRIYDSVTTTVEEYHGFSESAAKDIAAANFSSNLQDYNIRSGSVAPYSWIRVPSAVGTVKTAEARRQGNSRMFSVTVTTEQHACSNSAGWEEYTP